MKQVKDLIIPEIPDGKINTAVKNLKMIGDVELCAFPAAKSAYYSLSYRKLSLFYQQRKKMFDAKEHSVDDRIVNIHQPHVRPIVRGKTNAKVEFGAKFMFHL